MTASRYLKMTGFQTEVRRYESEAQAEIALAEAIELHRNRGFVVKRDADGKHLTIHPDGKAAQIWIENEAGVVVS